MVPGRREEGRIGGQRLTKPEDSERRCIVSGRTESPAGLLRFAVDPDGVVVPDVAERLPGRGMWVAAERALLEQAVERNAFSRAARQSVQVPSTLVADSERAVALRALELLGLARRSNTIALGFDAVREAVRNNAAAVVITAADASANALAKGVEFSGARPHIVTFSVAEMSLALGRENVVHAALAPGQLTERFLREALRLRGLRGPSARVLPVAEPSDPVSSRAPESASESSIHAQ